MDELLTVGAAELARRIKAKQISPVDVVEAHIRRIQRVNPKINAVIIPMFEKAREQAKLAAERIEQQGTNDLPPLFGVPITIKDCFPVAGERFVGGSWHRRDEIADEDAEAVRRLKDAGAIILGKTNCPDMCWLGETVNPVFGRTRNPWNLGRIVGGSSGGEGAIIAAGGSPLGLGSDIAGSVRMPAAATGIVSLKPTGGRIPTQGHIPPTPEVVRNWNTAGPMARRVEDLELALEVLSDTPVKNFREIDLEGRRLTVLINNGLFRVSRPVRETVMLAAGALRSAGMEVIRNDHLPILRSGFIYAALFARHIAPSLRAELGGGERFQYWPEVKAILQGRGRITPAVMWNQAMFEATGGLLALAGFADFGRMRRAREKILDVMTPGGVLICPLFLMPPPRHGWSWWSGFAPPYTFMFNAMELPAAIVPVQMTRNGLPVAVQIVGHPGEDETLLAVAAELERVFGGWQMAMGTG